MSNGIELKWIWLAARLPFSLQDVPHSLTAAGRVSPQSCAWAWAQHSSHAELHHRARPCPSPLTTHAPVRSECWTGCICDDMAELFITWLLLKPSSFSEIKRRNWTVWLKTLSNKCFLAAGSLYSVNPTRNLYTMAFNNLSNWTFWFISSYTIQHPPALSLLLFSTFEVQILCYCAWVQYSHIYTF